MLTWILAMLLTGWAAIAAVAAQDGPYNPTSEHPFGRPNPSAPAQLKQFAFMIGEFDCTDRIRQRDGSWNEFPASWHGYYFLNGLGIIDRYWNGRFATANTRVFDPASGKWKVTYFKMPGYGSSVWEGKKEGDQMVMKQENRRPDGTVNVSRLTFYDITGQGYEWKAEQLVGQQTTASWTSSCKRRK